MSGISMSGIIRLTVPMPDSVTNASGRSRHWRSAYQRTKAYQARLDLLQSAGLIPPPPAVPIARAMANATLYLGHEMDDDNALARTKPITDWLVRRGYLVDDRRSCLRWEALPQQVVRRGQDYHVDVTITPL